MEVGNSTGDVDVSSGVGKSSGVDDSSSGGDLTTSEDEETCDDGLDAITKAIVCASQKHSGIQDRGFELVDV